MDPATQSVNGVQLSSGGWNRWDFAERFGCLRDGRLSGRLFFRLPSATSGSSEEEDVSEIAVPESGRGTVRNLKTDPNARKHIKASSSPRLKP